MIYDEDDDLLHDGGLTGGQGRSAQDLHGNATIFLWLFLGALTYALGAFVLSLF